MSSPIQKNQQERNDLVSYQQVLRNNDNASAPLLREVGNAFGTAMSLRFEWDSGNQQIYSFLIRDADGFLQAKGNVTYLNTTLQSMSGFQLLKISNSSSNVERCQTYQVHNTNMEIGSITFAEGETADKCLKIHTTRDDSSIVVKSLKLGDFAIFRGDSTLSPICRVHMPNEVDSFKEFQGTLMFFPETGITTEEQLLCTAAAIVFKVSMKNATPVSDSAPYTTIRHIHTLVSPGHVNSNTASNNADGCGYAIKCIGYCLGCIVLIIIVLVLVAFFVHLEKMNCQKRKRLGYSEYKHREC